MSMKKNSAPDQKIETINSVRNLNSVVCDTDEIKSVITKWSLNEHLHFTDFVKILEDIGISTPVKFSGLFQKGRREFGFMCQDKDGHSTVMSIYFGDGFDSCSEIRLQNNGEEEIYFIFSVDGTVFIEPVRKS